MLDFLNKNVNVCMQNFMVALFNISGWRFVQNLNPKFDQYSKACLNYCSTNDSREYSNSVFYGAISLYHCPITTVIMLLSYVVIWVDVFDCFSKLAWFLISFDVRSMPCHKLLLLSHGQGDTVIASLYISNR